MNKRDPTFNRLLKVIDKNSKVRSMILGVIHGTRPVLFNAKRKAKRAARSFYNKLLDKE
jgi:hypothetical protein